MHVGWYYEFCIDAVLLVTSAFALARGRLEILLADFALHGLYHGKMNRTLTSIDLDSLLVLVLSMSSDRLALKYTHTSSVFILIKPSSVLKVSDYTMFIKPLVLSFLTKNNYVLVF